MKCRREAFSLIGIVAAVAVCVGFFGNDSRWTVLVFLLGTGGLLFFFRDPDRHPPLDSSAVLSGADGRVMSVTRREEKEYLNADCVRISVFLSIVNVHVNRSPITGYSKFIGYFPGKKHFAFREKASEVNQHNKILVQGRRTKCLVVQIVGPVARRVVYWLDHHLLVPVDAGQRIGMMKFGSRLDVYLPAADVEVLARPGDKVRAGETVIARIKPVASRELKRADGERP